MMMKSLRAVSLALVLGAGAVVVVGVSPMSVAEASVRASVGKPLQEAIALAKSGNGSGAMAKVREAEGVGSLTAEEQRTISQTKEFIAAKTGAGGSDTATGCQAKFANDYNAGRYHNVVSEDADCMRKYGAYNGNSQLIVAQAYYMMGECSTAIRMLNSMGDSENVLSLIMSCAHRSGDSDAEQNAAEKLIRRGNAKYWTYALGAAERTKGLKDHQNLDIYRIRLLTGNMRNADDYRLLTQLALQFGFSNEAATVAKKGLDAKMLSGDRDMKLLSVAQAQAAKDNASFAALTKQANAAKTGDQAVKLGENLWGANRAADGVSLIQSGLQKGVTGKDDAQIALGMTLFSSGQKGAAQKALDAVSDEKVKVAAHLWSLYFGTH
ncbi:MAG: hypothetical protein HY243_08425 [Proteobacteria bacterium]|nr:hypothetical protein [Pseudomonadota bacterium]